MVSSPPYTDNDLYSPTAPPPGTIPSSIGGLVKIETIQFASTKLSGTLPDLSSLLKLTYLSITDTKITGVPRCDLIIPQLPLGITKIDSGTCSEGSLHFNSAIS